MANAMKVTTLSFVAILIIGGFYFWDQEDAQQTLQDIETQRSLTAKQ